MKTDCGVNIIVLDSDDSDEDSAEVANPLSEIKSINAEVPKVIEHLVRDENGCLKVKQVKRLKPTLISNVVTSKPKNEDVEEDGFENDGNGSENGLSENNNLQSPDYEVQNATSTTNNTTENPITEAVAKLIEVCRQADPSSDMDQVINKKLLKYYHTVHPDFINSKSFRKSVIAVTEEIQANPKFVYLEISNILEELDVRRKSGQTVVTNEAQTSTGNERKDCQIRRLNKALYILKKKIAELDATEVDLDDECNSVYVLTERYKKRACEIYEKICDITGESKHAHRQVKKPIIFNGTKYPEFNSTIQAFVNQSGMFPDMFDVIRILEHCNQQYNFKLGKEEIKRMSQDAFTRIGKLLQKRRKTDLYETVSFYSGVEKDPAAENLQLKAKLDENRKYHSKVNEIIDKYAEMQERQTIHPGSISPVDSNKENQVKNDENYKDVNYSSDDESDADEEQTIDSQIEIVISESDEELS